jgi:hypothetical protein
MSGGGGGEIEEGGGGGGSNVFGEQAPASVTLNLTALMDILSNLLFFLLAAFGATIVMGINATVPVQSKDKSSVADTKQTVTAGISVGNSGFEISLQGTAQSEDELNRWHRKLPPQGGNLDYKGLTAYLLSIKQNYPKSDTCIITPELGVTYESLVLAMDAARETDVAISGVSRLLPLFPTVVLSTVIK